MSATDTLRADQSASSARKKPSRLSRKLRVRGVVALVAANLAIATWGGRSVHFALLLVINFLLITRAAVRFRTAEAYRSSPASSSRT